MNKMNTYAEFAALNKAQQDLVLSDFAKMLSDEYDMENVHDAARASAILRRWRVKMRTTLEREISLNTRNVSQFKVKE